MVLWKLQSASDQFHRWWKLFVAPFRRLPALLPSALNTSRYKIRRHRHRENTFCKSSQQLHYHSRPHSPQPIAAQIAIIVELTLTSPSRPYLDRPQPHQSPAGSKVKHHPCFLSRSITASSKGSPILRPNPNQNHHQHQGRNPLPSQTRPVRSSWVHAHHDRPRPSCGCWGAHWSEKSWWAALGRRWIGRCMLGLRHV